MENNRFESIYTKADIILEYNCIDVSVVQREIYDTIGF